uniref:Uncharacterized protein n=1 Tax=Klebsiella pneumoniae TaxID=573 RepID=A0A8B0SY71_KLEPN|nr:hypothetical protein [Klebsiella pneumoniae]
MPEQPLVFQSGTQSAGLELVDLYLWIFKRFMEGKELTRPLTRLGLYQPAYLYHLQRVTGRDRQTV